MQVFGSISVETSDNAVTVEPYVFSEEGSLRVYLCVKKRCYSITSSTHFLCLHRLSQLAVAETKLLAYV